MSEAVSLMRAEKPEANPAPVRQGVSQDGYGRAVQWSTLGNGKQRTPDTGCGGSGSPVTINKPSTKKATLSDAPYMRCKDRQKSPWREVGRDRLGAGEVSGVMEMFYILAVAVDATVCMSVGAF